MTVAERVARGVAKMDQHYPGWWRKIDCGRLNLFDRCIIQQTLGYGHYRTVLNEMGSVWGDDLGFIWDLDVTHDQLLAEWKRVIAHRLAEDAMAELNAQAEPVEV